MSNHYLDDDDMDSVLSSIMHGAKPKRYTTELKPHVELKPVETKSFEATTKPAKHHSAKSRRKFKKRYVLIPLLLFVLVGMAGAGFYYKDSIKAIMDPPAPFSDQLIQNAGFPLYYPTKLPAGFKLELKSVQSGNGVVLYNVSNDANKVISFSLQPQLSGMTIDTATESVKATTNSRKFTTPIGEASSGIYEAQKRHISNVLTGKTWLLINMENGTLSDSDIDLLLNNLKQAK